MTSQIKQRESGLSVFWKCYIQGASRTNGQSNITASFAEPLEFQEQMTFINTVWVNSGKSKKKK